MVGAHLLLPTWAEEGGHGHWGGPLQCWRSSGGPASLFSAPILPCKMLFALAVPPCTYEKVLVFPQLVSGATCSASLSKQPSASPCMSRPPKPPFGYCSASCVSRPITCHLLTAMLDPKLAESTSTRVDPRGKGTTAPLPPGSSEVAPPFFLHPSQVALV